MDAKATKQKLLAKSGHPTHEECCAVRRVNDSSKEVFRTSAFIDSPIRLTSSRCRCRDQAKQQRCKARLLPLGHGWSLWAFGQFFPLMFRNSN
jgi:hypothetical protein